MRYVKNILALLVIVVALVAANTYYTSARSGPAVKGITATEKLQSISRIVSVRYADTVTVTYERGQIHTFRIALIVAQADITTQEKAQQVQQSFEGAIAMILRLTAGEVLSSEPSIQAIGVTIVGFDGQPGYYYALAQDLKAMQQDAPDKAWLARLLALEAAQQGAAETGRN